MLLWAMLTCIIIQNLINSQYLKNKIVTIKVKNEADRWYIKKR